jgi:hypothetical protein
MYFYDPELAQPPTRPFERPIYQTTVRHRLEESAGSGQAPAMWIACRAHTT